MAGTGSLGSMSVSFVADLSNFTSGIKQAKGDLSGFSQDAERQTGGIGKMFSGMGGVIKMALIGAAGAVIGVGVASVKMAGDFQQSITKLYTTANESRNNLQMVGDGILAMAGQVGTSSQQLAKSMYWIESGGLHGKAGLDALRLAAEAATAENANLDQVSIALAASLNAYAGSGLSAVSAMNTLTAATGQGMMTFEQLSGSLASVLPASAKFGVSLTDVTAALATMTAQGDPAANAATHLRQILLALEAPSKIGAAALASVGLTSKQVADEMRTSLPDALAMVTDAIGKKFPAGSDAYNQAIKNIAGGNKQFLGFLELTGSHMKTFGENVDTISGKVKAAGNDLMGWADIQQNFNFKMDAAKASIEALGIKIGSALLPVLSHVMDFINPLIVDFTNWATSSDGLATSLKPIGDFLHYIYVTLSGIDIKPLVTAWGSLSDSFSAVGTALGNLVGPLLQTVDGFDPLTKNIQGLVSGGIKQATDFINGLSLGFENLSVQIQTGTGFVGTLEGMWKTVAPMFQTVADILGGALTKNMQTFLGMAQQMGDWWNTTMGPAIHDALPGFQNLANTILTGVIPAIATLYADLQGVVDHVMPDLLAIFERVAPVVLEVASAISNGLAGAYKFFLPFVLQAGKAIADFASQIADRVVPIVTNFMDNLQTAIDYIKPIWDAAWPGMFALLQGVWQQIEGTVQLAWGLVSGIIKVGLDILGNNWGAAWTDILNMLIDTWNGMVGVIGGALAMVGIHIGTFAHITPITMSDVSNKVSKSMSDMSSNVVSSTLSMKNGAYKNVSYLQSNTETMLLGMQEYGTHQMQTMDENMKGYWNDVADYITNHPINADVNTAGPRVGAAGTSNARAAGGMNLPAGWTLIGEKGPELMKLHGGEDIYPNGAYPTTMGPYGGGGSNAYPSGGSGGGAVHVYNDNRVYLDGQQMVDILAPKIVQQMRLKGAVRA